MSKPGIPAPIRDVVEASRKVVKLHLEFRRAVADESSEKVLRSRAAARNKALDSLCDTVIAFEKALVSAKDRGAEADARSKKPPTDWAGMFRAIGAFANVVHGAAKGDPSTPQKAKDFIEAEFEVIR